MERNRPSFVAEGQLWVVRVYLEDEQDPQVYTHAKHMYWQAGNTVFVILHYHDDGTHRFVSWLRENLRYYTVEREDPSLSPLHQTPSER